MKLTFDLTKLIFRQGTKTKFKYKNNYFLYPKYNKKYYTKNYNK